MRVTNSIKDSSRFGYGQQMPNALPPIKITRPMWTEPGP
jgi:hypothetical protein